MDEVRNAVQHDQMHRDAAMRMSVEVSRTKGIEYDVVGEAQKIYEFLAGHDKQPGRTETIAAASYDNAPQAGGEKSKPSDYFGLRLDFPTPVMVAAAAEVLRIQGPAAWSMLRSVQIAEHMLKAAFDAVQGFNATKIG